MDKLFEVEVKKPRVETCNMCEHRRPIQYGSKTIQYCGIKRSRMTSNGLLKIKCNYEACESFNRRKAQHKSQ
jgi:hypothetical protein